MLAIVGWYVSTFQSMMNTGVWWRNHCDEAFNGPVRNWLRNPAGSWAEQLTNATVCAHLVCVHNEVILETEQQRLRWFVQRNPAGGFGQGIYCSGLGATSYSDIEWIAVSEIWFVHNLRDPARVPDRTYARGLGYYSIKGLAIYAGGTTSAHLTDPAGLLTEQLTCCYFIGWVGGSKIRRCASRQSFGLKKFVPN